MLILFKSPHHLIIKKLRTNDHMRTLISIFSPQAVLASVIVVALKSMLFQYEDMPKFWKRSKLDGLLWIASFLATVILDIDSGLVLGIALNLLLLIYR